MPTPSPRGQEQAGGSDTPSPPQGRSPPCGRVLTPCNRNGSDQWSPCPQQYCVGVPETIMSESGPPDTLLCRSCPVWFNIPFFPTLPKHAGEGGVLRRPGPCRECAANPRAEESRGGPPPPCWPWCGLGHDQQPGGQMDARWTCRCPTNKQRPR